MADNLPNLLRGIVTTTSNVVLLLSLLQPKYSKKVTTIAMLGVLAFDFFTALYCYYIGDLTFLGKLDIVLYFVLCFAIKPLFRDTFMQWMFSYITVQNINIVIVVLSFIISRYLPMPAYANSLVRLIMYIAMIYLLRYVIRPLYRQVVMKWNIFFYVAIAIFINIAYYFLFSSDIVATLTENKLPLLLLIALSIAAYFSVFHSLKNLSQEYAVREENLKLHSTDQLLRQAAQSMEQRLTLMDEAARQMSIINHDRRHFNNTLLELLQQGRIEQAEIMLEREQKTVQTVKKIYCENHIANASIGYYETLAGKAGIRCKIRTKIPVKLEVDSLELSLVLSNLMENAINACSSLTDTTSRYINMTVISDDQLIIEIENPYTGEIKLDEAGYPCSKDADHGIGTRSVLTFARRYGGEVIYRIKNGVFNVRLMV